MFLTHRDAMRCFGYRGGHYQRAVWKIPGNKKELWFPKLYENKQWNNSLSDDFKEIVMKKKGGGKIDQTLDSLEWIVFAHYKDHLGQIVYKFLGEFQSSLDQSNDYQWVFTRTKSKIDITQF